MSPLAGLRLCLVGPGRVGTSLAHWSAAAGALIVRVAGRSASARTVAADFDAEATSPAETGSADCDLLLLAVADPALAAVASQLSHRPQAPVALHCSGSLGRSCLDPLAETGCRTGSCHPLVAFPAVRREPPESFAVGVDGVPAAVEAATRLAVAWGARPIAVPETARAAYHLAATLSAGGLLTLVGLASRLAHRAGLPREMLGAYLDLARSALAAAGPADSPARALTGAWARGDAPVVRRHLEAMSRYAPESVELLVELGKETLRQLGRTGPLTREQSQLLKMLDSSELFP